MALFVHSIFIVRYQNTIYSEATIDCLINNKTKNALHNETVFLNYICGHLISHGLST